MYRELHDPAKTLTFERSHARAVGECPVSHIGILIVVTCAVWAIVPKQLNSDETLVAIELLLFTLSIAYPQLWAIVHRKALEKKWLEEAIADEEAIETIERGGVPQGYKYEERSDLSA